MTKTLIGRARTHRPALHHTKFRRTLMYGIAHNCGDKQRSHLAPRENDTSNSALRLSMTAAAAPRSTRNRRCAVTARYPATAVRAAVRTVTIAVVAARRSNAVIGTPAAILVAIGFIESADVPNAIAIAVGGDGASLQQQQRGACLFAGGSHFGSTLLSLLVHSITPNGAPAGSASTAILPPCRST